MINQALRIGEHILNPLSKYSANSRNILAAKRLGLNAIAVRGNAINAYDFRVADKVLNSIDSIGISISRIL